MQEASDLLLNKVQSLFNDPKVRRLERVQSLWSGYGEIVRYAIPSNGTSCIAKSINLAAQIEHPRGWHTDFAHARKLSSYYNEQHFYQYLSEHCNEQCRVPLILDSGADERAMWLIMEDLDASGFSVRHEASLNEAEHNVSQQSSYTQHNTNIPSPLRACLKWLAHFHAVFLTKDISSVWSMGTYWFLNTRPDEFKSMPDSALKKAAEAIDRRLNTTKYQTLLHGDAKIANFCFNKDCNEVAAVDFQYTGRGCGVKDLVYLLGSYYSSESLFLHAEQGIDYYFSKLRACLYKALSNKQIDELEAQWRELICFAWADFHRFLLGWSPSHIKLNRYSTLQCEMALSSITEN